MMTENFKKDPDTIAPAIALAMRERQWENLKEIKGKINIDLFWKLLKLCVIRVHYHLQSTGNAFTVEDIKKVSEISERSPEEVNDQRYLSYSPEYLTEADFSRYEQSLGFFENPLPPPNINNINKDKLSKVYSAIREIFKKLLNLIGITPIVPSIRRMKSGFQSLIFFFINAAKLISSALTLISRVYPKHNCRRQVAKV